MTSLASRGNSTVHKNTASLPSGDKEKTSISLKDLLAVRSNPKNQISNSNSPNSYHAFPSLFRIHRNLDVNVLLASHGLAAMDVGKDSVYSTVENNNFKYKINEKNRESEGDPVDDGAGVLSSLLGRSLSHEIEKNHNYNNDSKNNHNNDDNSKKAEIGSNSRSRDGASAESDSGSDRSRNSNRYKNNHNSRSSSNSSDCDSTSGSDSCDSGSDESDIITGKRTKNHELPIGYWEKPMPNTPKSPARSSLAAPPPILSTFQRSSLQRHAWESVNTLAVQKLNDILDIVGDPVEIFNISNSSSIRHVSTKSSTASFTHQARGKMDAILKAAGVLPTHQRDHIAKHVKTEAYIKSLETKEIKYEKQHRLRKQKQFIDLINQNINIFNYDLNAEENYRNFARLTWKEYIIKDNNESDISYELRLFYSKKNEKQRRYLWERRPKETFDLFASRIRRQRDSIIQKQIQKKRQSNESISDYEIRQKKERRYEKLKILEKHRWPGEPFDEYIDRLVEIQQRKERSQRLYKLGKYESETLFQKRIHDINQLKWAMREEIIRKKNETDLDYYCRMKLHWQQWCDKEQALNGKHYAIMRGLRRGRQKLTEEEIQLSKKSNNININNNMIISKSSKRRQERKNAKKNAIQKQKQAEEDRKLQEQLQKLKEEHDLQQLLLKNKQKQQKQEMSAAAEAFNKQKNEKKDDSEIEDDLQKSRPGISEEERKARIKERMAKVLADEAKLTEAERDKLKQQRIEEKRRKKEVKAEEERLFKEKQRLVRQLQLEYENIRLLQEKSEAERVLRFEQNMKLADVTDGTWWAKFETAEVTYKLLIEWGAKPDYEESDDDDYFDESNYAYLNLTKEELLQVRLIKQGKAEDKNKKLLLAKKALEAAEAEENEDEIEELTAIIENIEKSMNMSSTVSSHDGEDEGVKATIVEEEVLNLMDNLDYTIENESRRRIKLRAAITKSHGITRRKMAKFREETWYADGKIRSRDATQVTGAVEQDGKRFIKWAILLCIVAAAVIAIVIALTPNSVSGKK